jgi:hypothetical protein
VFCDSTLKYLTTLFALFQEHKSYGSKPFAFILWCTTQSRQAHLLLREPSLNFENWWNLSVKRLTVKKNFSKQLADKYLYYLTWIRFIPFCAFPAIFNEKFFSSNSWKNILQTTICTLIIPIHRCPYCQEIIWGKILNSRCVDRYRNLSWPSDRDLKQRRHLRAYSFFSVLGIAHLILILLGVQEACGYYDARMFIQSPRPRSPAHFTLTCPEKKVKMLSSSQINDLWWSYWKKLLLSIAACEHCVSALVFALLPLTVKIKRVRVAIYFI